MKIRNKFVELTKYTCPHGNESIFEQYLPSGYQKDEHGNYYLKIGESRTMFTSHIDTACSKLEKIYHIFDGRFIRSNGNTILGADDKAGMTVMLYMIENRIPGMYYFFVGEEVGRIGSKDAALDDMSGYDRCISFDRRGYESVITHQLWGRCCSDEFAKSLCSEFEKTGLKFIPDSNGISTDSASFTRKISECTNISVGYFKEHTTDEHQDISFLEQLCRSVVSIDWENLPSKRDPNAYDYSSCDYYDEFNFNYNEMYGVGRKSASESISNLEKGFPSTEGPTEEDFFLSPFETESPSVSNNESALIVVNINGEQYMCTLKTERVRKEKKMIFNWAESIGIYFGMDGICWDGKSCYISFGTYNEYLGDRQAMITFIDELAHLPIRDMNLVKRIYN